MMTASLLLSEDQQMLAEAARNFCQKHTPISQLRALRDRRDETGFERETWQRMVALGWTGMTVPEAYGGYAFGYGGLGVVLQETGRTLTSSPLIASILIGATALDKLAGEGIKQELLPRLVAGELLLALALDERPLHQPERIATTAVRDGEDYTLNGEKAFVLDGHVADKLLVVARTSGAETDQDGISVFLVAAGTPGLTVTRTWMVDSRNAARVTLKDVRVPVTALLGAEGSAHAALQEALDIARIGVAAEMLGSVEETFTRTVDYLNQRQQFGVLIGSFQGLQHRAAIMYSEIELCRSAVRAALAALDADDGDTGEIAALASLAKAKLSEVFQLVSNEGIQMHGGIGMTDEFDIGFFIKRARVAEQFLGDAAFHRDRFATRNGF
ncbi:MAG: acyl-CoA dehydrogenase [Pseudohongiellaceae bacterium]